MNQRDVFTAYARLREAGLRVALRDGFRANTHCVPSVHDQHPAAGRRVPRSTVVTLSPGGCDVATSAGRNHPPRPVPDFVGGTVESAVQWAERLEIDWWINMLPPLPPSSAPNLLDNYRVVRQTPPPGTLLQRSVSVSPHTYPRSTPLWLWGTDR